MSDHVTKWVSAARATQDSGDGGYAHALMFSCDRVQGATLDAFQRGFAPPAKIYDVVRRSLEEGLNTTARPIVLAISRRTCDEQITSKCFFAGYVSGSSLGFAQTLAMHILTKLEKDWSDALAPWLRSISSQEHLRDSQCFCFVLF